MILHGQSASIKKQMGSCKEASGFSKANGILVWPRIENISTAYDNLIYFELSVLSLCKDLLHLKARTVSTKTIEITHSRYLRGKLHFFAFQKCSNKIKYLAIKSKYREINGKLLLRT